MFDYLAQFPLVCPAVHDALTVILLASKLSQLAYVVRVTQIRALFRGTAISGRIARPAEGTGREDFDASNFHHFTPNTTPAKDAGRPKRPASLVLGVGAPQDHKD
ncbi:MAG: hypothetical protein ACOY4T_02505 [Pseudomonadota bacterium]